MIKRLQNGKVMWYNSKAVVLNWEQRIKIGGYILWLCPYLSPLNTFLPQILIPYIDFTTSLRNILIQWKCLYIGMDWTRGGGWHCRGKAWGESDTRWWEEGEGRGELFQFILFKGGTLVCLYSGWKRPMKKLWIQEREEIIKKRRTTFPEKMVYQPIAVHFSPVVSFPYS